MLNVIASDFTENNNTKKQSWLKINYLYYLIDPEIVQFKLLKTTIF